MTHEEKATQWGLSRRDFLTGSALAAASAAAVSFLGATPAFGAEGERIGSWAADGSQEIGVPESNQTNASAFDGTYRDHNGAAFPANDASPIPPRAVPAQWDYECDICVVGAGGGGLNLSLIHI